MPTADLILKNANVLTIDARQPSAQLVAVKNGRIAFVGGNDALSEWQGAGTKVIDCAGKTVLPGFNDAHCHIFSLIRKLLSIDLSVPSIKSIEDIKAVIRKRAEKVAPGEWIAATDYNEFYLAEKRHPTRWELDEAAPENPVVLSHRSLHACVLNSKALEMAGIHIATPEPPGTFIGRRTEDGEPNGLLVEMLGYIREKVMPPLEGEELEKGVRLANEDYLSHGLTSLQDATYVNDLKRWRYHQYFKVEGMLRSRVYMMTGVESLPQFPKAHMGFGSGSNYLRLGAVKIVPSMVTGQLHPPREELVQQVLTAHRAGFQVAIHAVQEKLVDAIVGVYEEVQKQAPDFPVRRHRIEHCAECPPHLLERIKRLGLVIVTHPSFAYYSGDRYLAMVASTTIPYLYPTKALVESGLVIAGASDSPVVNSNPLMGIYGGATRQTSSGQKMSPEQAVKVEQVLPLYTRNAAYASHEEHVKGTLTAGKFADMVVLSDDPTRIPPEKIKDIRLEMTIIGGEVVWEG
ncbi:MAG: amidohydrolase [Dehalococcoidia bacterium]|nr:amidohydrolase [Dehalococcoidia bacterium]